MDAVEEFLRMGGYAAYVWPAFGVTAVLFVLMLRRALTRQKALLSP